MKKYFFSAFAIGIAIASVAFTTKVNQQWGFHGTAQTQITDYTKYTLNNTPDDCVTVGNAPCVISVPDAIDTPAELQSYFVGKSETDIMALSSQKRSLED